jgi:alpha-beta hydrolase superfamily lysophospholipase
MKRPIAARRPALRLAIVIATLAALSAGCMELQYKERELTFRPTREAAGWFAGTPAGVQDLYLPVSDAPGAPRIHAWWWPQSDANAPAIFYLHGARWNLTGQLRRIEQLREFGFSVFAIDYRGFGTSDGDLPSEETVYEDARVGWRWLAQRQPDAARRFIYGHSLGGAVAIDLAASVSDRGPRGGGLIVESSFTTLADIATALSYEWVPTRMLLSQKFDSIDKIRHVTMPVLIAHGAGDRYVPSRFSQALYDAAPQPKKLLLIDNAGHNNSMWIGDREYRRALGELFGLSPQAHAPATARRSTGHRNETPALRG